MLEWFTEIFGRKQKVREKNSRPPEPPRSRLIKENGKSEKFIESTDELKGMKKVELLDYAKKRGVVVKSSMKKQEIINAIVDA